jgi:hypothetical protein
MDTNITAWMIAGGPRIELASERRNREQLYAFRESQRVAAHGPGLIARLGARFGRPGPAASEPACCPA